jgi:hypothetical protein
MVILVILVILVMACILYSPKAEGYVHSQPGEAGDEKEKNPARAPALELPRCASYFDLNSHWILVILVILVMACILYSPKAEGYVHSQRSRPERNDLLLILHGSQSRAGSKVPLGQVRSTPYPRGHYGTW